MKWIVCVTLVAAVAGCTSDSETIVLQDAALLLAAGNERIDPASAEGEFVYELTTPAGEPFAFDLLSRTDDNEGPVSISLLHESDGGEQPEGGPGSIAEAGVTVSASGAARDVDWIRARGDGFVRVTLRGEIDREQVYRVRVEEEGDTTVAVVRVAIGPLSDINLRSESRGDYPGVIDEQTLYSSNSWRFGLPTIAVSGDRTSIVCYEGDQGDPYRYERYELRLQHDADSGDVTGGGSLEPSPDFGHWRDHECAALFNVLAVARAGMNEMTLKLSFDRGATFGQVETFGEGGREAQMHLVQIAMAADYSLAMVFWRTEFTGRSDLILVEGKPVFDAGNPSPVSFTFEAERSLYSTALPVSPVLMGATWSEAGDLVIGYGFSMFESRPDRTWTNTTQFRCAVRPWQGVFTDTLVEESIVVGKDPSVAVLGGGDDLRIFFAYEGPRGVRLRTSDDKGATWSSPIDVGNATAHMPSVFARPGEGDAVKVDLLYLIFGEQGMELHLRHWDDFDAGAPGDYRLTVAETTGVDRLPPDVPVPGATFDALLPESGSRTTQVAWFGYDAVLDGDEIVVVYDEETWFGWLFLEEPVMLGVPGGEFDGAAGAPNEFQPAEPPPLAPGLTEPVDPADPDDMHQLKLLRLE